MRAALDHLAGERRRAPRSPCSARWPSSARTRRPTTARSARTPARARHRRARAGGRAARCPTLAGFDGEAHPVATPEEAGALLEELAAPGRPRADQGLALGRPGAGPRRRCSARSSSGAWPPCSSACSWGRASSSTCARRSSASTSARRARRATTARRARRRWAGSLIFLAVCVPFLILSEYRAASLAVLGTALAMAALGFADDLTKLRKRRSLGRLGTHQAARPGADRDRALAGGDRVRRASRTRSTCASSTRSIDLGWPTRC